MNGWSEDDGPLESTFVAPWVPFDSIFDGKKNHLDRAYKIFKQETHEIDMYTHMHAWRSLLERRLGRPLAEDDYIFPHIAANGIPHPDRTMSYQRARELINEFTAQAGLTNQYSTHCFRRGGAQYRFMYAPIGQRWTLNAIRWWGGWADGEKVSTTRSRSGTGLG